ncbi:MAG: methyltransferase [Desulfobacteraceae bacterium]|nr:methyltransferase [Desulfobacteraceae bacterium]
MQQFADIADIPPDVRPIYERLRSKYSLEFDPLTVRGRRFNFLHLSDIEPLIGDKDVFADTSDFPFWVKIWEASIVLADFMARLPVNHASRVLELGAGLGVAGLVAAGFGHRVTITDYEDEILDFPRVSAAVNGCDGVLPVRLDWLAPCDLGLFDVIIGSEILFNSRFFTPLLNVFERYLAPDGVVYLAHDARRKSLGGFLRLCDGSYDIAVKRRRFHSAEESFEIILSRFAPKKNNPFSSSSVSL